jgi:NurA-like 5'-3' nuclease
MDSLELLRAGERWYEADLELLRKQSRMIERIKMKSVYLYMIPANLNYYCSHLHRVLAKLSDIHSEIMSMMAMIMNEFDPHFIVLSRYMIVNTAYGWILVNKFHQEASDLASKLAEKLSSQDRVVVEYVRNVVDRFTYIGKAASDADMLEYALVLKSLFAADVISRSLNLDFTKTALTILANSLGFANNRYVDGTKVLLGYAVKVRAQYIRFKPKKIDYGVTVKLINIPGRIRGGELQLRLEF